MVIRVGAVGTPQVQRPGLVIPFARLVDFGKRVGARETSVVLEEAGTGPPGGDGESGAIDVAGVDGPPGDHVAALDDRGLARVC